MPISLDHYTPCAPRPTEQYARYGNNDRHVSRHDILQQLSASITLQEYRLSTLARSFDINLECLDSLACNEGTPAAIYEPPRSVSSQHLDHQQKSTISPEIRPRSRPGRLSPTVLQTIFSPNISVFSEASSGADTSYDSGLYRWLGVSESSPRPLKFSKNLSDSNELNPDMSGVSSQSAYSQPSPPYSPRGRDIFPLSPPATVRPTFTESLCSNETEIDHANRYDSDFVRSSRSLDERCSTALYDFAAPLIFKNLSLQHYVPSALVLRHFQLVIDELRGKYIPNDQGNNAPKWERKNRPIKSPSLQCSPDSSSLPQCCDAVQNSETPVKITQSLENEESRTTQDLYTEMAGILFEQVARDEVQVAKLRDLADKLEVLTKKRRRAALLVSMRGNLKGNSSEHTSFWRA